MIQQFDLKEGEEGGLGANVPLLKTNAGTRPKRELQH